MRWPFFWRKVCQPNLSPSFTNTQTAADLSYLQTELPPLPSITRTGTELGRWRLCGWMRRRQHGDPLRPLRRMRNTSFCAASGNRTLPAAIGFNRPTPETARGFGPLSTGTRSFGHPSNPPPPVLMREGGMGDYRPLKCFWCGHVFHPLEAIEDHKLWCGSRPADA